MSTIWTAVVTWILEIGVWNDEGVWKDTSTWNDESPWVAQATGDPTD